VERRLQDARLAGSDEDEIEWFSHYLLENLARDIEEL
jgi:hypothetical protein